MPNSLDTEQNWLEFHILIDKAVNIQVTLDLFAWASFFHLIFEFVQSVTTLDWTGEGVGNSSRKYVNESRRTCRVTACLWEELNITNGCDCNFFSFNTWPL